MLRTASFLLLACAASIVLSSAIADEEVFLTIQGWGEVTDPAGDCKVTEHKGRVTIVVPGTHHNLNPTPKYKNVLGPRILQSVEGDFRVQVKVHPFPRPKAGTSSSSQKISYMGAGILIWHDGKNFIRCLRAGNGERDAVYVQSEAFRDGALAPFGTPQRNTRTDDKSTYLQLVRRGSEFTVSRSVDGTNWEALQSYTSDALPNKLQVGIAAVNATTKEFAPQFEALEIGK